jgi:hypothetical protein
MIRGAVITIEETVRQRAINDLAEQERTAVLSDAQTILGILAEQGTTDMLEPEHTTLPDALKEISTVLDVASAARAILLLLKTDESNPPL